MRKGILIFRIILYTVAAYILVDLFFFNNSSSDQLKVFKKSETKVYHEYYIKYNRSDSTWIALRTSPFLSDEINLGNNSIWHQDPEEIDVFKNYYLSGFYLSPDLILDRGSFYSVQKNIKDLKGHSDKRLNKLNDRSGITIIFEKK